MTVEQEQITGKVCMKKVCMKDDIFDNSSFNIEAIKSLNDFVWANWSGCDKTAPQLAEWSLKIEGKKPFPYARNSDSFEAVYRKLIPKEGLADSFESVWWRTRCAWISLKLLEDSSSTEHLESIITDAVNRVLSGHFDAFFVQGDSPAYKSGCALIEACLMVAALGQSELAQECLDRAMKAFNYLWSFQGKPSETQKNSPRTVTSCLFVEATPGLNAWDEVCLLFASLAVSKASSTKDLMQANGIRALLDRIDLITTESPKDDDRISLARRLAVFERACLEATFSHSLNNTVKMRGERVERATLQLEALSDGKIQPAPALSWTLMAVTPSEWTLDTAAAAALNGIGAVSKAITLYQKWHVWHQLIPCLLKGGRQVEARVEVERLLRQEHDLNDLARGQLLCTLADLEPTRSVELLERAWKEARSVQAKRSLGHHAIKQANWAEAQGHFEEALNVVALHSPTWYALAVSRMKCSEWQLALEALSRCLQLTSATSGDRENESGGEGLVPLRYNTLQCMATCHKQLGNMKSCLEALVNAGPLAPDPEAAMRTWSQVVWLAANSSNNQEDQEQTPHKFQGHGLLGVRQMMLVLRTCPHADTRAAFFDDVIAPAIDCLLQNLGNKSLLAGHLLKALDEAHDLFGRLLSYQKLLERIQADTQ